MLIAGEHARELISTELIIYFIRNLLNNNNSKKYNFILRNFIITIIPNANPQMRLRVEEGEFCMRTNTNGVDLNRNYGFKWEYDCPYNDTYQQCSGNYPFSENETQIISKIMSNISPDLFLTIHSGSWGMFSPHAYDYKTTGDNIENMLEILNILNKK